MIARNQPDDLLRFDAGSRERRRVIEKAIDLLVERLEDFDHKERKLRAYIERTGIL